ncbi:MAG: carbon-nitrogen hydrolase family protein [Alphaproteobacteria bacterium]|jgi:5-aminopentanamidase|nr:carbon-nitrogen hydrolase family protein [Alphaproteobacteria bacterium]MBU1548122.1 carbon-nitrogen hydrolase family protein [Alphaproteobacteria bacterium]MBU2336116.1 carbon-nitrogen hydrolase family protein [Alphaproteobacteria bacterium]MBU2390489.1 carbon-nitrogen hydrolase family protein [Alphaproteobacteria bacterium]
MKIAGFQMRTVVGDVEANLAKIDAAAEKAASQGVRLLIAPELALTGYGAGERFPALASPADGPQTEQLSQIARRHGLTIVAGFAEKDGEAVYNSAFLTDGKGQTATYRKSHLYGPYERQWFRPEAPSSILATVDGIRLGMLICYDVEFPENVRRLAQAGADLVVVPTALPSGWSGAFIAEHMIRVRAFENQVFVAYINHCGTDESFAYAGMSRIAAPDGGLLAEAPAESEALIVAEIDPVAFQTSRSENTYLADLR